MLPILALIVVFLESRKPTYFSILGSMLLVDNSRKGLVPAFLNSRLPLVTGVVFFL